MGRTSPPYCPVDRRLSGNCVRPSSVAACIMHSCYLWCRSITCGSAQVVQVKTPEREGYLALQLGCGSKREKQLNGRCAGTIPTESQPHLHLGIQTLDSNLFWLPQNTLSLELKYSSAFVNPRQGYRSSHAG